MLYLIHMIFSKKSVPKISRDIEIYVIDDSTYGYILLPSGSVKVVNSTGLEILKLCDGQHTVAEMASILAKRYGVDEGKVYQSVVRFLEDCVRLGVVEV